MIRNLSVHLAPSEDVAHALLLQGQANRKVAETPVNQRSSRSHAVFTVYLTAKKPNADIIVR
jgi:kinesin family protein 6/9